MMNITALVNQHSSRNYNLALGLMLVGNAVIWQRLIYHLPMIPKHLSCLCLHITYRLNKMFITLIG